MDKGKWQEVACSEVECWRAGNELLQVIAGYRVYRL